MAVKSYYYARLPICGYTRIALINSTDFCQRWGSWGCGLTFLAINIISSCSRVFSFFLQYCFLSIYIFEVSEQPNISGRRKSQCLENSKKMLGLTYSRAWEQSKCRLVPCQPRDATFNTLIGGFFHVALFVLATKISVFAHHSDTSGFCVSLSRVEAPSVSPVTASLTIGLLTVNMIVVADAVH